MKAQKKEVITTSEIKKDDVVNAENVKFAVDKLDTKKLMLLMMLGILKMLSLPLINLIQKS